MFSPKVYALVAGYLGLLCACTSQPATSPSSPTTTQSDNADSLLRRCRGRETSACEKYAKWYQYGDGINDVEQISWEKCKEDSSYCSRYVEVFPTGKHVPEAQQEIKEKQIAEAIDRKNNPDKYLPRPEFTVPFGLKAERLKIKPQINGVSQVCYRALDDVINETCADLRAKPGTNRVPLTRVRVVLPKDYDSLCDLSGFGVRDDIGNPSLGIPFSSDRVRGEGFVQDLYVMPGEYSVICNLSRPFAAHESASVGHETADAVRRSFVAPPSGGELEIKYVVEGSQVTTQMRGPAER